MRPSASSRKGRRAVAAALAATAIAVVPLHVSGAAASAGVRCPARQSRLIARDRIVRVYEHSTATQPHGTPVIACAAGRTTGMTLIPATPSRRGPGVRFPPGIGRIVLAGPMVACVIHQLTGVDTATSELLVVDASARRVLRSAAVGYSIDAGILAYESLTGLALAPDGAVAWLEERGGAHSSRVLSVYAAPPKGAAAVLDEGPAIDPASLSLSGATLAWSDAGMRHAAAMP